MLTMSGTLTSAPGRDQLDPGDMTRELSMRFEDRITHYHVVAGLSEGVNLATLDEAQQLAAAQASTGLTVRVWAVTVGGEWSAA